MSDDDEYEKLRKKIPHGEHLTTVDLFVNSLRPGAMGSPAGPSEYLINKAATRKAEYDEEQKRKRAAAKK